MTVLSHRPQCHSRGTSGRVPLVPASGDSLQTIFFSCCQTSFGQGFIFLRGERERRGKGRSHKVSSSRGRRSLQADTQTCLDCLFPFVHIVSETFTFPRPRLFRFCFGEAALFSLGSGSARPPLVPPLRLGHRGLRQLGGREGREALSPLSVGSAGALPSARVRAGAQVHAWVSATHALIAPRAPPVSMPASQLSHTHRHSRGLVLPPAVPS